MGKLISMTDFVFKKIKEHEINNTPDWALYDYEEFILRNTLDKLENYAKFLKQTLTLGMFAPCNLDGNVLEEPKWVSPEGVKWDEYVKEYQEAKDRVLFEGFEYIEANKEGDYPFVRIAYLSPINYPKFWNGLTVEHLIKYNLTLTESKAKELGL